MKSILKWLRNVLIAIDQLGNTIAGGNPDITISARVGYFAIHCKNSRFHFYWLCLQFVIDLTFYPLDGEGHCKQALEGDNESGHVHGSDLMRALLGIIAVSACMFIGVFTWTAYWLGYKPDNLKNV